VSARVSAELIDLAFAGGWRLARTVPMPLARRVTRVAADVATARNGPRVRQLRRNLRRVLGAATSAEQLEQTVCAAMRSYARYWLETFRLPTMDHRQIVARADPSTEGVEHLERALARGRGVIFALPHMGNWDVAALWLLSRGLEFATVVERLRPEPLFRRFVAYRRGLGMQVLPLTGGERPAAALLAERLRAGGIVCLIADRDLSRHGVTVQLFGEPTRMPPGPALLAATTGATLLPGCVWFTDGGWGQRISAPITLPTGRLRNQVAAGTQALADVFASEVRRHPSDWHMLQPLWLADLVRPQAPATPGFAPFSAADWHEPLR
jgi:KDO2-lipid IV(A) lauroyltransferase